MHLRSFCGSGVRAIPAPSDVDPPPFPNPIPMECALPAPEPGKRISPISDVRKLSDAVGHWELWNHLGQHCWGEAYGTSPLLPAERAAQPGCCCCQQCLQSPGSAFVSSVCGWNISVQMSSVPYLQHIWVPLVPTQPPKIA